MLLPVTPDICVWASLWSTLVFVYTLVLIRRLSAAMASHNSNGTKREEKGRNIQVVVRCR